jgi:hypothetical protein
MKSSFPLVQPATPGDEAACHVHRMPKSVFNKARTTRTTTQ